MRECGDCSLCCKLLSVEELNKPIGTWCLHAKPPNGCQIYGEHPKSCKAFECLWVQGNMPLELSPRKTRCVAFMEKDETGSWFVRIVENNRGDFRFLVKWIAGLIDRSVKVKVYTHARKSFEV